jgi:hypothetical protein
MIQERCRPVCALRLGHSLACFTGVFSVSALVSGKVTEYGASSNDIADKIYSLLVILKRLREMFKY